MIDSRRGAVARWLSLVLLLVTSIGLTAWWTASGRMPLKGDEPHYLIIAASVLRDFDFDVGNNYAQDAASHEIWNGELPPHALPRGTSMWPQHMPGLGVLLAAPFGIGGVPGARIGLVLLLIPVFAVAVYRWSRNCLNPADALIATMGMTACAPVVFGASQLYPDLPAGIAVVALAGWLWGRERRTRLGWCVYWLVAGMLCWLHVKYYAPAAILAVLGAWRLYRDRDHRFTPAIHAMFGGLFLLGPALFSAFSIPIFGTPMGGRDAGTELNTGIFEALEILWGLHVDQVHGLFVHQPLLLPGLVALGWMIRRRHPLTLPWLVLYASLIVPNALQRITYGGHVPPAGRFAWSAMWLWLAPLGIAGQELRRRFPLARWTRGFVALGIVYQAVLAAQWMPVPERLFNGLFPADAWQPSLFATDVMLSLPKLGLHGDIGYPPNVVWTLAALSLIAIGFFPATRLRYIPLAATALLAFLVLPVDDELERTRTAPRRYEAENTPARCTVHARPSTSNGHVCRQDVDHDFAVAGPFVTLEPGGYRIIAAVHQGRASSPGRGSIQVVANRGNTLVARHPFRLVPSAQWTHIPVEFRIDHALDEVEFRLRGFEGLEVDYIEIHSVEGS